MNANSTLYDDNSNHIIIPYNTPTLIGNRFSVTIHNFTTRKAALIMDVELVIDGICTVQLHMISQHDDVDGRRRMHHLQIDPPQCYRCYICGLCGDFQRASTGNEWEQLTTCDGGYFAYRGGSSVAEAYDLNGWSWEKKYVDVNCTDGAQTAGAHQANTGDTFSYISPCDASIEADVFAQCATAKANQSTCCNLIGSSYCDQVEAFCRFDACAASEGNSSAIASNVDISFTQPVQFVCNLSNVEDLYNATHIVEKDGAKTLSPTPLPTTSPTSPTSSPSNPTQVPSSSPTNNPTRNPSKQPSTSPTTDPTVEPTLIPTQQPSFNPTLEPTHYPSKSPTESPSKQPSVTPTAYPSTSPTYDPSKSPTKSPSTTPTNYPSKSPSIFPTVSPTSYPTLSAPLSRHFVLTLIGNFDALQQYLNDSNLSMVIWAKGVIQMMIKIDIYPQLTRVKIMIHNVGRGSIIIDYSLEVEIVSFMDLAEENVNSTAEIYVNENMTLSVVSNIFYTLNPTHEPSQTPTAKPTQSPLKPGVTHSPTMDPSASPTTAHPTTDPTVSPTSNPTASPTPQDIDCNGAEIVTTTDGEYKYFLYIDETSTVRFDTCHTLHLFDIFVINLNDTSKTYSCSECGSICHKPSQYQVVLLPGKYRMDIDGPHAFQLICALKPDTDSPTASPITYSPSKTPTGFPTVNPTTLRPTEEELPVFNVSFVGDASPISDYQFLGDPYGRFEASIEIMVVDKDNVLGISALRSDIFIWQYRMQNSVWIEIDDANNDDISVYNKQIRSANGITVYQSSLTIQSIRRLNAGRCVNENNNLRIFTPGNSYEIRLQFLITTPYFVSSISNILSITTNTLPAGGFCAIQDIENLEPLQAYNLYCGEWQNEDDLEFNALIEDTLMNTGGYVNDARRLQSIAPVGNVSITVMIKEKAVDNAITCYLIEAKFKSISNIISDKLNQNISRNVSEIVKDILSDVSTITNETSFSDKPDVAVSVVTVVEEIYSENLTTQNEAAMIVDDIVGNILDGSGVLDIVIQTRNNSDNISWVVLEGDDIITELSTISTITSHEDIVDAQTTTTVLVDSYLPQIFEAIDVFVDISAVNKTENASTAIAKQTVLQDQLYVIAEQSQELIANLEATLLSTVEAVGAAAVSENDDDANINETSVEQMVDNLNNLAQSLVEYATLAASKALSQSDVGETFNYESTEYNEDGSIQNKKVIIATKFDANIIDFNDSAIDKEDIILPKCGNKQQNIELPLSFMQQQDGLFDCAFMASSRNSFVSKQNMNRSQASDTVSINIYGEDSKPNIYQTSACFPYLITIAGSGIFNEYDIFNMELAEKIKFPSCDFWNTSDSLWDTSGCFVFDVSNNSVTCGCTHLTTFSLSEDDIIPEANILTEIDWKALTFENFIRFPTVWLTCLGFFIVFAIICWINPLSSRIQTKSIMAFEDIIYKSVQEEKLWNDIAGKEIKYITDYMPNQHLLGVGIKKVAPTKADKESVCYLQLKLFSAYLRNDHTLLSVLQRTAGTNFSLKQRLGCFFMYLCNIMVVTGTFYGLEQSTPAQDVIASFVISLCGTLPVLIVRKMFEKSKPIEIKSSKHILDDVNQVELDDSFDDANNKSPSSPDTNTEMVGYGEGNTTTGTMRRIRASEAFDMEQFMGLHDNAVTIRMFDEQIQKFYDQENKQHKIRAVSDIRRMLFYKMFPLPNIFKKIAWILLIIWSLAACITAIVYGFKFDLEAQAQSNANNPNSALYADDCWNTTLALQIEMNLSKKKFLREYVAQQAKNESSYAGGDTQSWLLSIFQSLLTSLLLWQPLTVYVITWLKIWLFSWHLKMQIGPGNVLLLCKRCCCGYGGYVVDESDNKKEQKSKLQMLSQYLSRAGNKQSVERRSSHKIRDVVAHENRPVDIISFLGNEKWIIDDTNPMNQDHDDALAVAERKVQSGTDSDREEEEGKKDDHHNEQRVEMQQMEPIKSNSANVTAGGERKDEADDEDDARDAGEDEDDDEAP